MKRILLLVFCQFGLLAGCRLLADVVTLKDGGVISGVLESGNTQELHLKAGDRSQTLDINDVATIRLGDSSAAQQAAPPPAKAGLEPAPPQPEPAQPNSLVLKDGTHVAGRFWSIDAANVHFLVQNQLQEYPRAGVLGVTFGNATLPLPAAPSAPTAPSLPPKSEAAPPAAAPGQPSRAPKLARSSAASAPRPSPSSPPAASTPPSDSTRSVSKPDEIGMVYFWNGKALTPLERSRAAERKSGSEQYWEIPAPQSRLRLREDSPLVFVVYLPQGIDPATYSLFPLETVDGARRTRSQPGRHGNLVTWPVAIMKKNDASIVTYVLTVKDLPTGEYSFSPSSSNDSYCFGVDPAPPGQ